VLIKQEKISVPSFSIVLIGLIISLLAFTSCSAEENQQSESSITSGSTSTKEAVEKQFKSISSRQAQEMMAQKKDLLVLDVRTPQERNQVRLVDSTLVPIGDVMRGRLDVPKEQPILVVCAIGGRSYIVSKTLLAMGHHEVYNLDGGIESWWRAGLPVETGPEDRKKQ
jgi:rhodanese-related sulfurtransferase